ncbi:hypothetical protein D9758_005450 [Tetrapyrgos nigripes]|uniref:Protein kinase domain-containing protein n=1 Tax=Tetrapyrgos nigripes TaxID=182062 RepID=A0A8H5GI08_9AGAR|nr:hypothetical protein D9758_005450 [Tetrapyrgos nigripes]
MAPLKPTEILEIFNSINDVVPFLAPVKAIVDLMLQALEDVEDNTHQCCYLLQRCVNLLACVNRKCKEGTIREVEHGEHLNNLKRTLNRIRSSVEQISRKGPFHRFFSDMRLQIAFGMRILESVISLAFAIEDHEYARRQDQDRLDHTLVMLQNNDQDILKRLDVTREEIKEATRGLQDTLSRRISLVQKNFAANTLRLLAGRETASSPTQKYEWAISSLEILIEDDVLGAGAFGKVYSGRWNGTKVAVKRLVDGTHREILVNEIEIWRRKQHPHIASFFRACIDSHPPLLVSEYYKFGNVLVYVSNHPDCNRLRLCYQIALGMQFLHNERANVLVDDAHRARITDFGLSRIKTSLTTQTLSDANGLVLPKTPGTKVYMAPERLRQGTNTFSTDVYAWGMSAYQILSDEAPFQYLPEEHLYECVVDRKIRPERPEGDSLVKRGLTDEVWELIGRSWADERSRRPQFKDITVDTQQDMDQSQTTTPAPEDVRLKELLENMGLGNTQTPSTPSQSGYSTLSSGSTPTASEDGIFAIYSPPSPRSPRQDPSGSSSTLDTSSTYTSPIRGNASTQRLYPSQHENSSSSEKVSPRPLKKSRFPSGSAIKKAAAHSIAAVILQVTVIGAGGVGKSTLLTRFSLARFEETYDPTIEEHYRMVISIAGSQLELNLTDTAGQEEYALCSATYYRHTEVALLCYSLTSRSSFETLGRLISEFRRVNAIAPMVFAGLKLDLEREVSRTEGEHVAKTHSSPFFECSSKSGYGVNELLMAVASKAIEK